MAFEVIKLPNERVIGLFHHFFLQFLHMVEIGQKAHNTTISRTPVPCILQILTTFNLYSGRPTPFRPHMSRPKWLDHRSVNFQPIKVKVLKFVSMSAVTPYRNYVQYEGGCAVRVRHLFSTSDDVNCDLLACTAHPHLY